MLIVSLSGGSGSGKTTLAEYIASKFKQGIVSVIPIDAYYKDHSHLSADAKISYNFDHPDAIDFDLLISDLQKLKMSIPIDRPIYSFLTCAREKQHIKVIPPEILILEGLMALTHEKLRMVADVKIFLEVSETIRLERTVNRDVTERGRSRKMVEERFYETVQPMHEEFIEPFKHNANFIIDGNNINIESIAKSLLQKIGKHLHKPNLHRSQLT